MTKVSFWTPGAIPLDAFTLMGANVKVNDNPIGQFGTGLKYAVAVILRHGGAFRLFINDTEYEFYTHDKAFRGQNLETIRMRKRDGTIGRWLSSRQLPFTLNYGRNWKLWQAYRELESNTRDENGMTYVGQKVPFAGGTLIEVECPGFAEAIIEEETFFYKDEAKLVYSDAQVDIYDRPSKHFYYRGIRVYDLRYPAKLTYDWKHPYVQLTEDRTAGNSWSLIWQLARTFQHGLRDEEIIKKALLKEDEDEGPTFEEQEFSFDETSGGSAVFSSVVSGGYSMGRSLRGYWGSYQTTIAESEKTEVTLTNEDWETLLGLLKAVADESELDVSDAQNALDLHTKIMREIE